MLGLGLNFALGANSKDLITSISQINNFNYYHPDINTNFLKGFCLQAFGCTSGFNDFSALPRRYRVALTELMKMEDIKIMRADKGGAVVVMDTIEYNLKAM